MVEIKEVDEQLQKINCNFKFWGRAEIKELAKILSPGETIHQCLNGQYEGGFAVMSATSQRLLLIDRKPMYLTIWAVPYDKISQIYFNHRLINSTAHIFTPNNDMRFTSWNHARLREIVNYTQERMTEMRMMYQQVGDQQQAMPVAASTFVPSPVPQSRIRPSSLQMPNLATIANDGLKTSLYTSRLPLRRRFNPQIDTAT